MVWKRESTEAAGSIHNVNLVKGTQNLRTGGTLRRSDELEPTEFLGKLWTFTGQGMGSESLQSPGGLNEYLDHTRLRTLRAGSEPLSSWFRTLLSRFVGWVLKIPGLKPEVLFCKKFPARAGVAKASVAVGREPCPWKDMWGLRLLSEARG